MVLTFSKIPPNLQVKIAEKIDSWTLKEFRLSSKQGYKTGNLIRIFPIVKVFEIEFNEIGVFLVIQSSYDDQAIYKPFETITHFLDSVRFSVSSVLIEKDTNLDIVKQFTRERIRILEGEAIELNYHSICQIEIIEELAKHFTIKKFETNIHWKQADTPIVKQFLSLPVFRQVESFDARSFCFVPNDVFLNLNAPVICIKQLESYPADGSTLNQFFKECASNHRKIDRLQLEIDRRHSSMKPDELFAGLDYQLLWSLNTHESSHIAHFKVDDNFRHLYGSREFYCITGGGKKIVVFFEEELFGNDVLCAEETLDEKQYVYDCFAFLEPQH